MGEGNSKYLYLSVLAMRASGSVFAVNKRELNIRQKALDE